MSRDIGPAISRPFPHVEKRGCGKVLYLEEQRLDLLGCGKLSGELEKMAKNVLALF